MRALIAEVTLGGYRTSLERSFAIEARDFLRRQLGTPGVQLRSWSALPEVEISLHDWASPRMADVSGFDRLFEQVSRDGEFRLCLECKEWRRGRYPALQLLTRYQRFQPAQRRLQLESIREAELVLRGLMSEATDRARLARSLDRARWVTRLNPFASRPVQLAALFLEASSDDDPLAGARTLCRALEPLGMPQGELFRAAELLIVGPAAVSDADRTLLRDADTLAFFNVETFRYLRAQGAEAARAEARRRLACVSADALILVMTTKQPVVIQDYLRQAASSPSALSSEPGSQALAW